VPYIVCSRGRPIGHTELEFVRVGGPTRVGWFHPNADGERLGDVISAVHVALHAYARRDRGDDDAASDADDATPRADLAEALHHSAALDLTLHRDDGSLVPTRDVHIQDTHQLIAFAEWDDARRDADAMLESDDALDDEPACDDEPDADIEAELAAFDAPSELDAPWVPDDEPSELPRYQILVELVDEHAIP
jgi:hypothetical protein